MIEFGIAVVLVALFVKFLRTLAEKWGILSYLQAHQMTSSTSCFLVSFVSPSGWDWAFASY